MKRDLLLVGITAVVAAGLALYVSSNHRRHGEAEDVIAEHRAELVAQKAKADSLEARVQAAQARTDSVIAASEADIHRHEQALADVHRRLAAFEARSDSAEDLAGVGGGIGAGNVAAVDSILDSRIEARLAAATAGNTALTAENADLRAEVATLTKTLALADSTIMSKNQILDIQGALDRRIEKEMNHQRHLRWFERSATIAVLGALLVEQLR